MYENVWRASDCQSVCPCTCPLEQRTASLVLWAIGGGVTLLDLVVLYNSSQYSVAVPHWGLRGAQASDSHGPQIVDMSPNLIVLLTHCGQLIITKISKFNAIRCLIPRLKCTKSDFPAGKLVFPQIPWRRRGGRRPAVNLKVHTYTRSFANIPITKEDLPFSLKITVLETSDSKQKNSKGTSNVSTYTT